MMLSSVLIVRLIIMALGTISLSYLASSFWKLRNHFLINLRCPITTLYTTIILHLAGLIFHIKLILEETCTAHSENIIYIALASMSGGLAYLSDTLIIYRLLLIYKKSIKSKTRYQHKSVIISPEPNAEHLMMQSINTSYSFTVLCKKHSLKIIVAIVFVQTVFFCFAYYSYSKVVAIIRLSFWIIYIFFSAVMLFKSHKRLNGAIFCLSETYVIIIGLILQIVGPYIFQSISVAFNGIFVTLVGLITVHLFVCIPLYVIWRNDFDEMADLSKIELPANAKEDNNLSLHEYLNSGKENFEEFVTFLTSVLALESLLFLVRVIVFRHILIEHITNKTEKEETEDIHINMDDIYNNPFWSKIYSLKFNYLVGIYDIKKKAKDLNDKQFYEYFHSMAENIYNEFIADNGEHQINISFTTRNILEPLFKDDVAVPIAQYLNVYHEAVMETYRLLTNVYNYQFKLKKQ